MRCPADYNQYLDATDFRRVLLAIYAKYPALENNRVVIVGESYGGRRAQIMLHALRNPAKLERSDGMFVDASLAQDLFDHAERVAERRCASGLSPGSTGDQFGWQIRTSVRGKIYSSLLTPSTFAQLMGAAPSDVRGTPAA